MLGFDDVYTFYSDLSNFDEEYQKLSEMIRKCASYVFTKYATPKDVYNDKILPVLKGIKELPDLGAEWLFEYLARCKVVEPENDNKLKDLSLKRAEWLIKHYKFTEPNMAMYYDRLDEILGYLESLSVDDLMKTKSKK